MKHRRPHRSWLYATGCTLAVACGVAAQDSPADLTADAFAGPVFAEQDGLIIVEPEDLALSEKWEFRTDPGTGEGDGAETPNSDQPETFTGRGYVRWAGPHQGMGHDEDEHHQFQGDHRDWIVVKVRVTRPGPYRVDVRNFHRHRDGDNDVWVGLIGQSEPVKRMADRHTNWYTWVDWDAAKTVVLEPGLNAVYLAGRSRGFGIDRIAILSAERESDGRDPDQPASPIVNADHPLPLMNVSRLTGAAPHTVTFDASVSSDDGVITGYQWTLGEKTFDGPKLTHTFHEAGTHRVQLAVTDDAGNRAQTLRLVRALGPDAIDARLPRVSVSPQIGGTFDALLQQMPAQAIAARVGGGDEPGTASGHWRGGWDDEALYLAVNVTDDIVRPIEGDIWQNDSLEVFVDADASRSGAYGKTDRQFLVPAVGGGVFTPGGQPVDAAQAVVTPTEGGYRVELMLPWRVLGTSPSAHTLMGLELHLNDDDDGNGRDAKLSWHGDERAADAYRDPRTFGIVELQARQ